MEWRNKRKTAQYMLPLMNPGAILIVFDTETTGLGKTAKIIQFSAEKYRVLPDYRLQLMDDMNMYINPLEPLSEKIIQITGITDAMLMHFSDEFIQAPKIFDYLEDADVLAGYNVPFDLRMLRQMGDRTAFLFDEIPSIDVLAMAKDMISTDEVDNHKLGTVFRNLFPDVSVEFHNSAEDVRATSMILEKLLAEYVDIPTETNGIEYHVRSAKAFVNPKQKSQQRIRLELNIGEKGDIYYDCIKKTWSHKKSPKAVKLFQSCDMEAIEAQVLKLCSSRWKQYASMEELARDRIGYIMQKK